MPNGNVSRQTDRAGRTTAFTYDEFNRNVATTLQNGDRTRTIYSAGGRVAATVDATAIAPIIPTIRRDGDVGVALPPVVNGMAGPPVRPMCCGHSTGSVRRQRSPMRMAAPDHAYDAAGRLVRTNHSRWQQLEADVRRAWPPASVVNEEGQQTTFSYDGLGRLVAVSGLAGDATYAYDEAGNLLTQTDALGRVTRIRYDALNRPVEQQYPGGEIDR